jgi:hypothetical protein
LADLVLVFVALAFFALCAAYVRALDRMVASSGEPNDTSESA